MRKITLRVCNTTAIMLSVILFAGCAATTEPEKPAPAPQPEAKPVEAAPVVTTPAVVEQPKPAPVVAKNTKTYTVARGDNLWDIAAKPSIYNDAYYWPLIYRANRNIINDADLIEPGQQLEIEVQPSTAAINAAVEHAKTRGPWKLGVVEESDKRYLSK